MTRMAARYRIRGPLWSSNRTPLVLAHFYRSFKTADNSPDSLSNLPPAPTTIKDNPQPSLALPSVMPLSPYPHRTLRPTPVSDAPMKDATSLMNFVDPSPYDIISPADTDQMIFGPLDLDDPSLLSPSWDPSHNLAYNQPISPILSDNPASPRRASDFDVPDASPSSTFYDSHSYGGFDDVQPMFDLDDSNLSQWLTDSHVDPSSSSPIPIRGTQSDPQSPPAFVPYGNNAFPQNTSFSPSDFAALHPLPRSLSPTEISDGYLSSPGLGVASISPAETSLRPPAWASQLWDSSHYTPPATSGHHSGPHSPLSQNPYTAKGQRFQSRRDANPLGLMFQSSSAPSNVAMLTRAYSRRSESESVSVSDDRDATVRRRKKLSPDEPPRDLKSSESRTCISDHIRPFCDCRHVDYLLHYLRQLLSNLL